VKWIKRIWARIKRRRRISAAKIDKTPLREFVYLDEVSVYSLLASRKGPLATEYTDTQENAESSEISGSIGNSAGVLKASNSSKLSNTQTRTTQVLRKSTIQAAFKELHEGEQGKLAISAVPQKASVPSVTTWNELDKLVEDLAEDAQWAVDPTKITRGRLFELAIELAPDEVYRLTSMMNEMVSIVSENSQLFPGIISPEVQKIAAINRVLDNLLVGLIPLKCRVVDYRAVDFAGKKFLVHSDLLDKLPSISGREATDLYVAGVTEQRLFWKDVRRVLFSGSQFRAMCRANGNGIQDSWVPVKLFNVLRDVVPDLADNIDEVVRNVLEKKQFTSASDDSINLHWKEAMIDYGLTLAGQCGGHLDRGDLEGMADKILSTKPNFKDLDSRREAFTAITQRVSDYLGVSTIDQTLAAQLRTVATIDAGLSFPGGVPQAGSSSSGHFNEPGSILDVEIVAIYWLYSFGHLSVRNAHDHNLATYLALRATADRFASWSI
jgi:hypothetical protein